MNDLSGIIRKIVSGELRGFGVWAYGRYWSGTREKDGTITIVSKGDAS